MDNKKELRQVIRDTFTDKPQGKYEGTKPEDVLLEAMYDILGTRNPTAYQMTSPAMHEFYALVLEEIGREIPETLQQSLEIAEYKNVGWGDKRVFHTNNPQLLDVQVSAKGNGDARVQRIEDGVVSVDTDALKIKAEIPFMRWASGRINPDDLKTKIVGSYVRELKKQIYKAFFETTAFNSDDKFNTSSTGGLDAEKLYDLIDLVEGTNGTNVVTLASKKFLRALVGEKTLSDAELQEINQNGFLRMADGNMFMAMEHVYDKDFTKVFDDNTAIVVPVDDSKIIKIVEEGETMFEPKTNTSGNMAMEWLFYKHVGVALVTGRFTGRFTYTS